MLFRVLILIVFLAQAQASDLDALESMGGLDDLEGSASLDDLEGSLEAAEGVSLDDVQCPGAKQVCTENKTGLPLRVLPRPFSHLYDQPQAGKDHVLRFNVPAFHPWYVFDRKDLDLSDPANPKGWYQVGKGKNRPQGWMRAVDVFEWRQALLVSYTHPGDEEEGRKPVLMFSDEQKLLELAESDERAEEAEALYQNIEQGRVPEGVVSMEPKRFVDITQKFYLLPILQFRSLDMDGDDARLLQIAAAVPRSRGSSTLENSEYAEQVLTEREAGSAQLLQDLKVDVVFVMDTTSSMQPYIDMTRDAMKAMAKQLGDELKERVKFGLVGYRDSTQIVPGIGYTTKNFTPQLVGPDQLSQILADQVKAARVGSKDYQEEVFAGVDAALESAWRDNSLKFIILVGDASAHPKGHPQNTTGKGADDLLRQLDDRQVHLVALHLQNPAAAPDFAVAEQQFRTLSTVRGSEGDSAYYPVNVANKKAFAFAASEVADQINQLVSATLAAAQGQQAVPVVQKEAKEGSAAEAFNKAWEAALIEYLGQEAEPPKDVVAWVIDRDLVDPAIRSLDVRVLITRNQLSSLAQTLDRVIQAMIRADTTQEQFFQALQGIAGQAMKRPEDISKAQKLVDTGLLPAFITTLPYKSNILSLTDEMFSSMTADDRANLQWSLMAKLKQYREINEQVDAWQKLNEYDKDSDKVYPLNINYLP